MCFLFSNSLFCAVFAGSLDKYLPVGDTMRIISILSALDHLPVAEKNKKQKNKKTVTLERDTRAIASLDCKSLTTATKVEAALDVERETKTVKEMPKRMRVLLQPLDNPALSTRF